MPGQGRRTGRVTCRAGDVVSSKDAVSAAVPAERPSCPAARLRSAQHLYDQRLRTRRFRVVADVGFGRASQSTRQ